MRGKKGPMRLLRFQGLQKQVFASPDAKLYGPSLSVSRNHGMLLGRRLKVDRRYMQVRWQWQSWEYFGALVATIGRKLVAESVEARDP